MKTKEVIISAKDLKKGFGTGEMKQTIFKHMNLEIYKGDFTIIMGSSGAGKSTLMYSLSGMDRPTEGNIAFAGKEITNNSIQKSLFDDNSPIETVANVTVNPDGTSYAGIPIVMPTVFATDTPVQLKDDLKSRIVRLYEQGKSIDEIAAELSCSTTEVQFVIDFSDDII